MNKFFLKTKVKVHYVRKVVVYCWRNRNWTIFKIVIVKQSGFQKRKEKNLNLKWEDDIKL